MAHRIVTFLVGLLLLSAGLLKLFGQPYGPEDELRWISPSLAFLLILLEILLGLWLASGMYPRSGWAAALTAFSVFAAVNLAAGLQGQLSCGCFGTIPVNPWITFLLDAAILVVLIRWRPQPLFQGIQSAPLRCFATAIGAALAIVLVAVGIFFLAVENPLEALAALRGDSITVEPTVMSAGEGKPGQSRTFYLSLNNHTDRTVQIIGGTNTCTCMVTEDLPMTIEPKGTATMVVHFTFPKKATRFRHAYLLYTDCPQRPRVLASVTGVTIP